MTNDEAMLALYEHIREGRPVGYSDLSDDERLAYMAEKNRQSRARQREAAAKGEALPTKANIRAVLADAALMLLATDGPGAEQIRTVLAAAFPSKPGLLLRVDQQAKAGVLKPKLVDAARVAEHTARLPRKAASPEAVLPAPEPEAQREPVGAMTPEEIEAIVPAFLRRGT